MIKGCSKSGEKDCFCCSFCFIHSKFVLLMKKRISAYPRKIGSFLGRSFVLEIPALFILNAVWAGLRAVCGRADTGGSGSGRAREAVQTAGGGEGSSIRYGRVLLKRKVQA